MHLQFSAQKISPPNCHQAQTVLFRINREKKSTNCIIKDLDHRIAKIMKIDWTIIILVTIYQFISSHALDPNQSIQNARISNDQCLNHNLIEIMPTSKNQIMPTHQNFDPTRMEIIPTTLSCYRFIPMFRHPFFDQYWGHYIIEPNCKIDVIWYEEDNNSEPEPDSEPWWAWTDDDRPPWFPT